MTYQAILDECERDQIGPLFWDLLVKVAGRIARGRPPEAYGEAAWSEEAIRDLAQDVALLRLIEESQLEYVLELAIDMDSLRRLLSHQVKRTLSRRRTITVVDRLLTRIGRMVSDADYRVTDVGREKFISLGGGGREPTNLSETELRRGALLIDSIPRLASRPSAERESKVYNRSDLSELVRRLVTEFNGILIRDVRKVLEITLTSWLPTILFDHKEEPADESNPEIGLERSEMKTMIKSFVADLEPEHRDVLLGKTQEISDDDLATRLGRSRPWVADRKKEVLEKAGNVISDLPPELHTEAAGLFLDELTAEEVLDD